MYLGFLFLAVLPLALCDDGPGEAYIKPQMPAGRYEDMEPLATNNFKIQELNRSPVYGLWQYRLYQDSGETYIATSHFDNMITHTGDFPVLKWKDDDEVFEALDTVFPQVDGNTRIRATGGATPATGSYNQYWTDFLSIVYPFQTQDGTWWAYDSVGLVEDNRDRYRNEVTWTGDGYLRSWDNTTETWGDPTFTWSTAANGFRPLYFIGSDNREYLWTYTYGNDSRVQNWQQGVYQCWLLGYNSDSTWSVLTYGNGVNTAFPGCPKLPRSPVVFTNVNGDWMFLATSQGTPSCPTGTGSCAVNKDAGPATWWTTNYYGKNTGYTNFWNVSDMIDPFSIPSLQEAKHWVYDGFDYIVALTDSGVATYRLWWTTHEVEQMPFVPISQPDLRYIDIFNINDRNCFMVSSSYHSIYPQTPIPGVEDSWTYIYCWDAAHDNWDFAAAIPSEGTLWATIFTVGDRQYIVRVEEGHHQTKNIHVYRLYIETDESVDIYFDVFEPSHDAIYKRIDRNGDRIHKTLAVTITGLCIALIVFIFVLIMLYLTAAGGGGGGSGGSSDYRSM